MEYRTRWFIVLSLLLFLVGCQMRQSAESDVAKAEQWFEKGDMKAASIELKNALVKDAGNAQARWLLGRVYVETEEGAPAEKELRRALELGVVAESVYPLLARALLLQEKFQDVLDLDSQFQGWGPAAKSNFLTSRGFALLNLRRNGEALQEIDNALGIQGDSVYALLVKAKIKAIQGDQQEARSYLDKIFKIDGEYGPAWSFLGDIERYAGNFKEAELAYSKAIEFRVVAYRDILSRSLVRIGIQKLDEAEKDINTLAKLIKNHPDVSYAQGLLYFYKNVYGDAQSAFEKVLSVDSNYLPALLYAGASHYMQGNKESAESYLTRFVAKNQRYLPASRLLALIKLEKKDYEAAERLIREASVGEDPDEFTLTILANALMGQNKVPEGLGFIQELAALQPDSAQVRANLGLGLLRNGDTEAAISELEIANKLDPEMRQVGVKLVLIYLANKQLDRALDAALSYKDRHQDAEGYLVLGLVHMARNEADKAGVAFEKTLEIDPGNTSATSALALAAIQSNQLEKAKKFYKDALEKHPGHLSTLLNLASVNYAQKDMETMKSNLSGAIEKNPDALSPRLILGRVYLEEKNPEKTIDLLSGLKEKNQSNLQFLTTLAEAEVKTGKWPEAKRTLSRIVELAPGSAAWRFQLAKANAQLGSKEDYRNELQKTLETAPNHLEARMALTDILIREGNKEVAREQIKILKEQSDNSAEVLVLDGRLEELSGNKELAAHAYQEAFNKAKNNFNLLRVSNMRWEKGERSEAVEMLETWLKEYPDDALTRLELANRYLNLERSDEAISSYRKVIGSSPNNIIALNNISFLLLEKNPAESLTFAKQASDLAPQSPELKDTLALALMHSGDVTQARKVIEKVASMRPENSTYRYHQAMILQKAGERDEALSVLQPLVEQENEFPEKAAALALYREISEK